MNRIYALVLLSALLMACPTTSGGQTSAATAQARAELQAAEQKAAAGDPSARADLAKLQQQYAHTDVASGALFQQAELDYRAQNWAAARAGYTTLLTQDPLFPKADTAKYHLGMAELALGDAKDALQTLSPLYDKLPAADKPAAAAALSKAAVGTHDWAEAVRFLAEGEGQLQDPAARAKLQQKLYDLVDAQVPELDIAKLAQEISPQSPAYALVMFKLAKIQFHLHDWNALTQTLQTLQQNDPQNPFSADAKKLLDRASRRDQVKVNAVGVLLPLSGRYQRFGETALAGIKLALEGSGVQLIVKDTKGEPDLSKRAVQQLVLDDQVIAVVGPIVSSNALAAAIDADELGVPIITLSREESLTHRGPYVFRDMLTNSEQAQALADYAIRVRGYDTFGVMYPTIPYGEELANGFWDDVLAHGGEVTAAETYDHDQTTFGPTVKKMVGRYYLTDRADYLEGARKINERHPSAYQRNKAFEKLRKNLKPVVDFQALFIPDGAQNVGLIAPALAVEDLVTNACDTYDLARIAKTMGLKRPEQVKTVLLLGANGWDSPDLATRGGKFVDCAVFVDGFFAGSKRPSTQAFTAAFQAAHHRAPNLLSAYGYDAGLAVRQLVDTQKVQTRDAFRDGLARLHDLPGAGGPLTVRDRELSHPLFFLTVDAHKGIQEIDVPAAGSQAIR